MCDGAGVKEEAGVGRRMRTREVAIEALPNMERAARAASGRGRARRSGSRPSEGWRKGCRRAGRSGRACTLMAWWGERKRADPKSGRDRSRGGEVRGQSGWGRTKGRRWRGESSLARSTNPPVRPK